MGMETVQTLKQKMLLNTSAKKNTIDDNTKTGIRFATSVKVTKRSLGFIYLKYCCSDLKQ